jgi:UDP-glucuronate decarboxylase
MAMRSSIRRPTIIGNVNPVRRRACYDERKRCAETLFLDYRRQHALDARVARIFHTDRPRMHPKDGRVVPNFIMQALAGEPITIYGDGSQTRSFCHVSDLLDALTLFMRAQPGDEGPLNLGNPGEFTIRELAELVLPDQVTLAARFQALARG